MSVLGLKLSMEKSWKRAVSVLGLKLSTEKSCVSVSAGPEAVHGKELSINKGTHTLRLLVGCFVSLKTSNI